MRGGPNSSHSAAGFFFWHSLEIAGVCSLQHTCFVPYTCDSSNQHVGMTKLPADWMSPSTQLLEEKLHHTSSYTKWHPWRHQLWKCVRPKSASTWTVNSSLGSVHRTRLYFSLQNVTGSLSNEGSYALACERILFFIWTWGHNRSRARNCGYSFGTWIALSAQWVYDDLTSYWLGARLSAGW